ncbi:MAG: sugar transferase [Paludibacteraceae bacterium]|nr:sugar transferase [Paludibacteraceae bacterium]
MKSFTFEIKQLILDLFALAVSFFLVVWIAPLNANDPISKYSIIYGPYALVWILIAWISGRYRRELKIQTYGEAMKVVFLATIITYAIGATVMYIWFPNYSLPVVLVIAITVFIFLAVCQSIYFAIRYASDPESDVHPIEKRAPKKGLQKPDVITNEGYEARKQAMLAWMGEKAFNWLDSQIDIHSTNTQILSTTELFNFEQLEPYKYSTIVNVRSLNNIRGINRMFSIINEKLPDDGLFVGVFKDKSVKKHAILQKYPKGLNWIVYTFYYFIKRVIPKLFLTKRLYYDITGGKHRVLSKTEVLGRLYYCGFEIVTEKKIEKYTYFVAKRIKEPPMYKKRRYGLLIKLNRVGKNGEVFKFYKTRTMYPYSEFIQDYMYKTYGIQKGGKFNHDIRVSTVGSIMRKCWLDELPMFINFFKGDMKFVGVRPISNQYFNLYCDELQELRVKFKPGLFPPFYADMPETLEEIQASEMKYLKACEKNGTFVTDVKYMWMIMYNIIFKRARSK